MNPEFTQAIHDRVDSETLPMVESFSEFVQTLPLHPAQKHQLIYLLIANLELTQKLCWEGSQEIIDEWEVQTIRTLREHNKL